MGQNPDGLTTHWQRLAGSWLPYWEGMVRTIKPGSALGQRDRCMLDLCTAVLELSDRLAVVERKADGVSANTESINQMKEELRKQRTIVNRIAANAQ